MAVEGHLHSIHPDPTVATAHRADPAQHDASFSAAPYAFAGSRHRGRPPEHSGSSRPSPSSKRVYGRLKAFISDHELHIPTRETPILTAFITCPVHDDLAWRPRGRRRSGSRRRRRSHGSTARSASLLEDAYRSSLGLNRVAIGGNRAGTAAYIAFKCFRVHSGCLWSTMQVYQSGVIDGD